ncbi:MAG: CotH kinase family protein [Proteiniphilum sp.]|jgi:spore coat protein CotH|uniref:CotH kinase family protein n=1 Tax=Proteiniphilum sp. TaxID=1926877 RepID=UPI00092814F4|nr:CotH kinase family protein [Proteiniphilum sp.]MEA5127191.1 CotH kinase family protein [Proteiniphilum sp.]OJV86296.1 MAG: hypothetical protein BGO34_04685 [Bacteroidia bacterium 44-10]
MNYLNTSEEKQESGIFSKIYPAGIMLLFFVLFCLFTSCSDEPEVQLSSEAQFESFSFSTTVNKDLEIGVPGKISGSDIIATIPYGVSPDGLIATFTYSGKSVKVGNVEQKSDETKNNFSSPVVYSVFAEDGTKKDYIVTIVIGETPDPELESFSFSSEFNEGLESIVTGEISGSDITISIPYSMSTNALVATFKYIGNSVKIGNKEQTSNVTPNDFSEPVVYSIASENGKKTDYTVTVTKNQRRIPRVYINTAGGVPILDKENYVTSTVRVEDLDSYYTDGVKFTSGAGVRGRGNSTWGMDKKPYRIKLDNKASLLGMSNDKDWALLANHTDKTLLRNITAFEISKIAGMSWTPTSYSVDFYLNDEYKGVYALTEHVKVAKERLDMELVKSADNSGEALTGGYFMELDFHFDEPYKFKTNRVYPKMNEGLPIMFKDPDEPTDPQFNYVRDYFNTAEEVLYGDNFIDPEEGYRKYIDVESFINYYIVQELAKNVDGNMRGSCYLAIRRNGKIEQPLVWDFDIAFGNADHITWEQGASSREWDGWFINSYSANDNTYTPWFDRFFEDPHFVSELKKRWNELKPQLDGIPDFIREHAAALQDSQARNFGMKANGGAGWSITKPEWNTSIVRGSYKAEVDYLVDFVEKRLQWLDTNINKL